MKIQTLVAKCKQCQNQRNLIPISVYFKKSDHKGISSLKVQEKIFFGKMGDWELSKENIQPLRSGRKASSMMEQTDSKQIAEEKQ